MKALILSLWLWFSFGAIQAQVIKDNSPMVGIIADYYGFKQNTFAVGLAVQPFETSSHGMKYCFVGFSGAYEFSTQTNSFQGANIEAWFAGSVAMSLNFNYHKNGSAETLGLKPSIGLSFFHLTIMYGYNFFKNDPEMPELRHNIFTVRYYVRVWRKA